MFGAKINRNQRQKFAIMWSSSLDPKVCVENWNKIEDKIILKFKVCKMKKAQIWLIKNFNILNKIDKFYC